MTEYAAREEWYINVGATRASKSRSAAVYVSTFRPLRTIALKDFTGYSDSSECAVGSNDA
jgi:hypothetical protein